MAVAKTTLYLDRDLRARLKTMAAEQGRSLTEIIDEGLRQYAWSTPMTPAARRRIDRAWRALERGVYRGGKRSGADRHDDIYDE